MTLSFPLRVCKEPVDPLLQSFDRPLFVPRSDGHLPGLFLCRDEMFSIDSALVGPLASFDWRQALIPIPPGWIRAFTVFGQREGPARTLLQASAKRGPGAQPRILP
jgi:hypothetical protein